ncbi:MAG: hypothetical protein MAGBODY4_01732 [Candidatus Marinimicrobia bacterium]|nr:hypothetical protein [Candidatus Neomarinimicrobiota bacterium]
MSEEILDEGIVKRIEGDKAFVTLMENDTCEDCGAKILCAPNEKGERGVLAKNEAGATTGQKVIVTESRDLLLKLSLMQYGLPLLGFLLGIFALYFSDISVAGIADEVVYFVGGLVGLALTSALSWKWAALASQNEDNYFEISKIYSNGSKTHEKVG